MQKVDSSSKFLLVTETAGVLGVSANTVRAWAASGKLIEHRHPVNNYRLFRRSEVEALARKIANPPESATRRKPK